MGDTDVGDALLELTDLLKENGFNIISTAIFVSQHSILLMLQNIDPNEKDLEKFKEFVDKYW